MTTRAPVAKLGASRFTAPRRLSASLPKSRRVSRQVKAMAFTITLKTPSGEQTVECGGQPPACLVLACAGGVHPAGRGTQLPGPAQAGGDLLGQGPDAWSRRRGQAAELSAISALPIQQVERAALHWPSVPLLSLSFSLGHPSSWLRLNTEQQGARPGPPTAWELSLDLGILGVPCSAGQGAR